MFDNQYYPTPKEVIKQMLKPYKIERDPNKRYYSYEDYNLENKLILEPSAGEGFICDFITDDNRHIRENISVIELNPDFQHTLRDKGYTVIDSDFLTYKNDSFFDLIIMNPPFKDGDKHLLKAWEILHEGDIICLLNEETIKNPYSKNRKKIVNLIENHGSVEYIETAFVTAQRSTAVRIALVRLNKPAKDNYFGFDKNFTQDNKEMPDFDSDNIQDKIMTRNIIQNLMIQQENANKAVVEFIKTYNKLKFYTEPVLGDDKYNGFFDLIKYTLDAGNNNVKYNYFSRRMKVLSWQKVLQFNVFEKYMSHTVKKDFQKFIEHQSTMAFSYENIINVIEMLIVNRETLMERAIAEVFDELTYYHEENRIEGGWKTNDSYKVNRRVIIPYAVSYGSYYSADDLKKYGDNFSVGRERYTDIDKVLAYIRGYDYNNITSIYGALDYHFRRIGRVKTGEKFNNKLSSTFFDIKFWKKGTVHLYFKDEKLWQFFNEAAAKGKNWLPPGEKVKNPFRKDEPEPKSDILPQLIQTSLF